MSSQENGGESWSRLSKWLASPLTPAEVDELDVLSNQVIVPVVPVVPMALAIPIRADLHGDRSDVVVVVVVDVNDRAQGKQAWRPKGQGSFSGGSEVV